MGEELQGTFVLLFSVLSIVATFATAYFSFYIYRMYGEITRGWYTICIALAIMVLARIATLLSDADYISSSDLKFLMTSYFMVTSLVLFFGFWQMRKTFEEHEFIEKETMERVRYFEAGERASATLKGSALHRQGKARKR